MWGRFPDTGVRTGRVRKLENTLGEEYGRGPGEGQSPGTRRVAAPQLGPPSGSGSSATPEAGHPHGTRGLGLNLCPARSKALLREATDPRRPRASPGSSSAVLCQGARKGSTPAGTPGGLRAQADGPPRPNREEAGRQRAAGRILSHTDPKGIREPTGMGKPPKPQGVRERMVLFPHKQKPTSNFRRNYRIRMCICNRHCDRSDSCKNYRSKIKHRVKDCWGTSYSCSLKIPTSRLLFIQKGKDSGTPP